MLGATVVVVRTGSAIPRELNRSDPARRRAMNLDFQAREMATKRLSDWGSKPAEAVIIDRSAASWATPKWRRWVGKSRGKSKAAGRPLRLVGGGEGAQLSGAERAAGEPLLDATDPRWVLAVRTAELMEGEVLRPERRERLLRLGRVVGLTPFDSNLVIAIVQDQARRGFAPRQCPAAGKAQLQMVALPRGRAAEGSRAVYAACVIASVLAGELVLVGWLAGLI